MVEVKMIFIWKLANSQLQRCNSDWCWLLLLLGWLFLCSVFIGVLSPVAIRIFHGNFIVSAWKIESLDIGSTQTAKENKGRRKRWKSAHRINNVIDSNVEWKAKANPITTARCKWMNTGCVTLLVGKFYLLL